VQPFQGFNLKILQAAASPSGTIPGTPKPNRDFGKTGLRTIGRGFWSRDCVGWRARKEGKNSEDDGKASHGLIPSEVLNCSFLTYADREDTSAI